MEELYLQVVKLIGAYVPNLLGALAILVVGWLIAWLVSAIFRGIFKRTQLDENLAKWIAGEEKAKDIPIGRYIAKTIYYVLLLFVLIAFFQALGLTIITEPLNQLLTQIFVFAPQLLAAAALLLVAWLLATFLRLIITRGLTALKLDERLGEKALLEKDKQVPLSKTIANAVYWLIFLLFLPAILDALRLEGLLKPIQGMLDEILTFLPNLFTAALIILVGWFVASILRRIISNLLAAVGTDRLSDKAKISSVLGDKKLSDLIGLIIYIFILIPIIISALQTLALDSITQPAMNMLNMILTTLPMLFAAALIIVVAYIVGKILAGFVSSLLAGLGFNSVIVKLGLAKEESKYSQKASDFIGYLILLAVIFFASIEALRMLNFNNVAELVTEFTTFAGQIVFGLIIFGVGLFLANLVAGRVRETNTAQAGLYAWLTKVAIMVLVSAMALQQMGFAEDIVITAFGLGFGAVAVAAAIAFGIGSKDIAARQMEKWVQKFE